MRFRIFVVSSVILFISAVLAIWKDYDREWKVYQKEFNKIEYGNTVNELNDERKILENDPEFKKLKTDLLNEEKKMNAPENTQKNKDLEKSIIKQKYNVYVADREIKFSKSRLGAIEYQLAKLNAEKVNSSSLLSEKNRELQEFEINKQKLIEAENILSVSEQKLNNLNKVYNELNTKYKEKLSKAGLLERKLESIKNRPVKIQQVIIPELNNAVDRCMTCHLAIDRNGFEDKKYPVVFQTHPNRELYLGKHKIRDFGCVICHQGQGLATKTREAHGFIEFWSTPMFTGKQVEASCIKCHEITDNIQADYFQKGKELVNISNCFGCHKADQVTYGLKNGPPLLQASSKLNPVWMLSWIGNPRYYLPKSKMPTFLFQKNEVKAITAYILSTSDPNYGEKKNIAPKAELIPKGEKLFQEKGCNTCHSVKGQGGGGGPDLGRVSSKTNPTWMFNWIKNPRTYHPATIMPSFGLNNEQVLSLVSYLYLNYKWDNMPQDSVDINDKKLVEQGRNYVLDYGCASCHEIPGGIQKGPQGPDLTGLPQKDIHKFDFGLSPVYPERGVYHTRESYIFNKIRDPWIFNDFVKARMPGFWFTDDQINQIYTYITGVTGKHEIPYKYIYKPKQFNK